MDTCKHGHLQVHGSLAVVAHLQINSDPPDQISSTAPVKYNHTNITEAVKHH